MDVDKYVHFSLVFASFDVMAGNFHSTQLRFLLLFLGSNFPPHDFKSAQLFRYPQKKAPAASTGASYFLMIYFILPLSFLFRLYQQQLHLCQPLSSYHLNDVFS